METKKLFVVHVLQHMTAWDVVEVRAESQQEAEGLAVEEFEFDWSCSDCHDFATTILAQDGEPVERSEGGSPIDPRNPYRKRASTS